MATASIWAPGYNTNITINSSVVNSIAALRLVDIVAYNNSFVLGYLVPGDGGGGYYFYDSTDVSTADNGGTVIVGANGERWKLIQFSPINAKQFGIRGSAGIDDTARFNTAAANVPSLEISAGEYKVSSFPGIDTQKQYKGIGLVNLNFFYAGINNVVAVKSNTIYEDINFNSTILDLNSQRVAVDDCSNVTFTRCGFTGFRNPTNNNGWGVLLQRCNNITFNQPRFYNNTQADIAFTDHVEDVSIIGATNPLQGGINLNVEPNTINGVTGLLVTNSEIRLLQLLEPETTAYASRNLVFIADKITQLIYDGCGAKFVGCSIGSIVPEGQALNFCYAGPLSVDSMDLDINLITDPYLFDVSATDTSCFWTSYSGAYTAQKRINDSTFGKYCRLNPDRNSQPVILTTRDYIPVTAGEVFLAFMRSRCFNSGTGVLRAEHMIMQWFNSSHAEIQTTHIVGNRAPNDTDTEWNNDCATPKAPAGSAYLKVRITTYYDGDTTSALDVAQIGLFRFVLQTSNFGGGNQPEVIGEMSKPVTQKIYYQNQIPTGNQGYSGAFIGERIVTKVPSLKNPQAWVCTALPGAAGEGGTFVDEFKLGQWKGVTSVVAGIPMLVGDTQLTVVAFANASPVMPVTVSPDTYPGDGFVWDAYVSSAGNVTVRLTAIVNATPASSSYNFIIHK